ncbi:VOC family protein [Nocardioides sp. Bht2]|uniref:VOC family protein n=1 Tax=Nocardioides sp. Bht2 TaxID=3392297 RepID=UPI0039B4FB0F
MISISYVELTVTDLAEAKRFYTAAFGWKFNDYGPGYAGIQSPDGSSEVGGLAAGAAVAPGGPLVLLEAEDLAAARSAIEAAGGAAHELIDYPGGQRFEFTDPSGNRLGVFRSAHS